MRLKAIAVDRAPTMATAIQTICHSEGRPRAASTAPKKANGNANSVCSILTISSVVRMFLRIIPSRFVARYCTQSISLDRQAVAHRHSLKVLLTDDLTAWRKGIANHLFQRERVSETASMLELRSDEAVNPI